MFGLGATEIVIILVVLVIIFFGAKKLSGLAKSAGRLGGEFKKGKMEIDQEIEQMKNDNNNG
jgi:sec-independent protein translocase protein TatA